MFTEKQEKKEESDFIPGDSSSEVNDVKAKRKKKRAKKNHKKNVLN